MSDAFLNNFLQFIQVATDADRSMALDGNFNIQYRINVDDALLEKQDFAELLQSSVDEALTANQYVITNNLITDPDDAPKTNLHLHQLRMVVAIPISGYGAVYLDKPIRKGVLPRDLVERIHEFAQYVVDNDKTDLSADELGELFNA